MIRKGFYFSSKTEKNKGDRDFNEAGLAMQTLYFTDFTLIGTLNKPP